MRIDRHPRTDAGICNGKKELRKRSPEARMKTMSRNFMAGGWTGNKTIGAIRVVAADQFVFGRVHPWLKFVGDYLTHFTTFGGWKVSRRCSNFSTSSSTMTSSRCCGRMKPSLVA